MLERAIGTQTTMDISSHLAQRLTQTHGGQFELREEHSGAYRFCIVSVPGDEDIALEGLANAVSLLIQRDYLLMDMARYIRRNAGMLSSLQARRALMDTLRFSRAHEPEERVLRCIREQLSAQRELVIEGLLRFRMPDIRASWIERADCALQDMLFKAELAQYSRLMNALAGAPPLVHVVFQPGGAYLLMDKSYQHLCEEAYRMAAGMLVGEALLLGLIAALAPARIVVYNADDAPGCTAQLRMLFGDKVIIHNP